MEGESHGILFIIIIIIMIMMKRWVEGCNGKGVGKHSGPESVALV